MRFADVAEEAGRLVSPRRASERGFEVAVREVDAAATHCHPVETGSSKLFAPVESGRMNCFKQMQTCKQ